jgi:hypothetical protein
MKSSRVPIDLQAATRDIKQRISRVIGNLEPIAQTHDPIFVSPRDVMLELVIAQHELEATISAMRRAWWP